MQTSQVPEADIHSEDLFGRLPLLDAEFPRMKLLAAISRERERRGEEAGFPPRAPEIYLDPLVARQLYAPTGEEFTAGAVEMSGSLLRGVECARARVASAVPEWRSYLDLSVRLMSVDTNVYFGYSCLAEPQHIYLGSIEQQLADDDLLLENYLHEFAHVWLYLIQELRPFQTADASATYTLPSGTAGRSLTATMDAAFVASVLRRYYSRSGDSTRRRELSLYLGGCLLAIRGDSEFTPAGRRVCMQLARQMAVAA